MMDDGMLSVVCMSVQYTVQYVCISIDDESSGIWIWNPFLTELRIFIANNSRFHHHSTWHTSSEKKWG